jgi:hypothetical protein
VVRAVAEDLLAVDGVDCLELRIELGDEGELPAPPAELVDIRVVTEHVLLHLPGSGVSTNYAISDIDGAQELTMQLHRTVLVPWAQYMQRQTCV